MPLPDLSELFLLNFILDGEPFVFGSTKEADFLGLERAYIGMPYIGVLKNSVRPTPATGILSGRVPGVCVAEPTSGVTTTQATPGSVEITASATVGIRVPIEYNYTFFSGLNTGSEGEPFSRLSTQILSDFFGLDAAFSGQPGSCMAPGIVKPIPAQLHSACRAPGVYVYAPVSGYYTVAASAGVAQMSGSVTAAGLRIPPAPALLSFADFYSALPRTYWPAKYYSDLAGLDWVFLAEPYCTVAASDVMNLLTLDYFYQGQPFSGATGPMDRTVRCVPAEIPISVSMGALTYAAVLPAGTMDLAAQVAYVVTGVVPYTAGVMTIIGGCVQVGNPLYVVVYATPGVVTLSYRSGLRESFPVPAAGISLEAQITGIVPASCRIVGGLGELLSAGAIEGINGPYKGLIAAAGVLAFGVPDYVPVMFVRCLPLYGIDSFTKISLRFDGDFTDASPHNCTPTVFNGAVATVPGYFAQGGSFREPKDVVEYPYNSDWSFLTGDFNISFRFKPLEALVWQLNGQYHWVIASSLKTEWDPQLPYDPMYPERGDMWGNGWYLCVDDEGFGPRVMLVARRNFIAYSNPPYESYFSVQYEYVTVLKNVMPFGQVGFLPPAPLGEWITVSLGRAGNQGYIVINGERKPITQDFHLDTGLSANYQGGGSWVEGPWEVFPHAPLTVGGMSPGNADPFSREVFPAALGVVDEFQIDKGAHRNFTSCPRHPDPLFSDGGSLGFLGGVLSGETGEVSFFPTIIGARRTYECLLDGGGLGAITIPVSEITCRLKKDEPSYAQAMVPGIRQLSEIMARLAGNLTVFIVVTTADGLIERQREGLFTTPISQIAITGNDTEQYMTLSGYRDEVPNAFPKTATLANLTYINMINGQRRFRSAVIDMYIKPGDTVVYEDEEFIAGTISCYISSVYASSMEIAEG